MNTDVFSILGTGDQQESIMVAFFVDHYGSEAAFRRACEEKGFEGVLKDSIPVEVLEKVNSRIATTDLILLPAFRILNLLRDLEENEVKALKGFYEKFAAVLNHHLKIENESDRARFKKKLRKSTRISLLKVRTESGFEQRMFQTWLSVYFGEKYRRRKYVSIPEYEEIWNALAGNPESDEDFQKLSRFIARADKGIMFSKNQMRKVVSSDYPEIRAELDELIGDKGWEIGNRDKVPVSIVLQLYSRMLE